MDVFSRMILAWVFQPSVKQNDVVALMRKLDLRFGLKGVIIRNDNGSQFIAHKVRQTLQDMEARQEFTHVATPEENAYIESLHSIQQRELIERYSFESFYEAKQHIQRYMHWYNYKRRHGSLQGLTPVQKWVQARAWWSVKQLFVPAWESMSRPDCESPRAESAPYSLDLLAQTDYLCLTGNQEREKEVANLFDKNVQTLGS